MSQWAREHPEAYEEGILPPDWREVADLRRKEQKEEGGQPTAETEAEK